MSILRATAWFWSRRGLDLLSARIRIRCARRLHATWLKALRTKEYACPSWHQSRVSGEPELQENPPLGGFFLARICQKNSRYAGPANLAVACRFGGHDA